MRRGFIRAAGALALALSCALLMNPAMAEEYPGDTYVTATFLDAEAHTRDGWGARAGLSLEGFPSRRVVLSSALSYRAADDYATFIPGLGLEAGYRFPVAGLAPSSLSRPRVRASRIRRQHVSVRRAHAFFSGAFPAF
jgi:hypothetical protein